MLRGPRLHPWRRARLGRPRGHVLRKADCLVSRGPLGDWCTGGRDEGPASSAPITRPSQGLEGRHRSGASAAIDKASRREAEGLGGADKEPRKSWTLQGGVLSTICRTASTCPPRDSVRAIHPRAYPSTSPPRCPGKERKRASHQWPSRAMTRTLATGTAVGSATAHAA